MIGIIFNPRTNKGTSVERMAHIRAILEERGIEFIYSETEHAGHAKELAKELADRCDVLVPAGGDGTVYEVVNGALDRDVTFFPLPMGSGNDICCTLGLKTLSDEELVDALQKGNVSEFNYADLNGQTVSLILISFGIVTDITYQFAIKEETDKRGYFSTLLKALRLSRPRRYKVVTEKGEKEYFADFISVQNLPISGGGMQICPGASENDSFLDLVVVEHRNLIRKYLNVLALNGGKLNRQPNVHYEKLRYVEITPEENEMYCIDGELDSTEKAVIRLGRRNLKFIRK